MILGSTEVQILEVHYDTNVVKDTLGQIWNSEEITDSWTTGLRGKFLKKGDLSDCNK